MDGRTESLKDRRGTMTGIHPITGLALAVALMTGVAHSAEPSNRSENFPGQLGVSVEAGFRYEDHLVDTTSNGGTATGDVSLLTGLDLDYDLDLSADSALKSGYTVTGRHYLEQSEFNLQVHYAFADISREIDAFTYGVVADGTVARSAGRSVLNNAQFSGYLSGIVLDVVYLRGQLGYRQTRFGSDDDRRDDNIRGTFSAYGFIDGRQQYTRLVYRREREWSSHPEHGYNGHRLTLGYTQAFDEIEVKLDWRYEIRTYDLTTTTTRTVQEEQRQRWRLRLESPITPSTRWHFRYERRHHDTDQPFTDNRVAMSVEWKLI